MNDSHLLGQPKRANGLVQERHTPGQRLDEVDSEVSPPAREGDTRQSGSTAHVHDLCVRWQQIGYDSTVE